MANKIWINPKRPDDLLRPYIAIGVMGVSFGVLVLINEFWFGGNWIWNSFLVLGYIVAVLLVMATTLEAMRPGFVTTTMSPEKAQDVLNGYWADLINQKREDDKAAYRRKIEAVKPKPDKIKTEIDRLREISGNAGGAMVTTAGGIGPQQPEKAPVLELQPDQVVKPPVNEDEFEGNWQEDI